MTINDFKEGQVVMDYLGAVYVVTEIDNSKQGIYAPIHTVKIFTRFGGKVNNKTVHAFRPHDLGEMPLGRVGLKVENLKKELEKAQEFYNNLKQYIDEQELFILQGGSGAHRVR